MEMRALSRCLRSRPTSSLLYNQPSSRLLLNGSSTPLRHNSTNSKPSRPPFNPRPQSNTRKSKPRPSNTTAGIDQILNDLNLSSTKASSTTPTTAAGAETPDGARHTRRGGFLDPLSLSRAVGASAVTEHVRPPPQVPRKVELKLGPTLGRQVHVEPEKGVDLAAALRQLQIACSVNRVRQQSNQQKFHVRRGQMKKNLRMERWRKLFKFSFTHTVNKIQRMRAQGW